MHKKDNIAVSQLKKLLKVLEQYNNTRTKLNFGFTPCLDSLEKIYNGKLYGIFSCFSSEYGHNIAMVFLVMQLLPSNDELASFDRDQPRSIISWYVYLKLECIMLDYIRYPNRDISHSINKLIDLLK